MIKFNALLFALTVSVAGSAAFADPARETVSVEFQYEGARSAAENYRSFNRQARNACEAPGLRPLAQVMREKACTDELMDKFIAAMGRTDLASIHAARTGRHVEAPRDLASR